MAAKIKKVKHISDYKLMLTFASGETGVIDLTGWIVGQTGFYIEPLQDINFFAQAKVLPGFWTVVWPNEADFDPDVLYKEMIRQAALVTA